MCYGIERHRKGEQGIELNYIKVPGQDLYWWLISIGLAEAFKKTQLILIVSQLVTMLLSSTYRVTDFLYPLVPMKKVFIKHKMDKYLLYHHWRHFHQANGTPFTIHPLRTLTIDLSPLGFLQGLQNKTINIEELKVSEFTKDTLRWLTPSPLDPPVL
eukprot:2102189-Ditylum_brightwellii.AAC.1